MKKFILILLIFLISCGTNVDVPTPTPISTPISIPTPIKIRPTSIRPLPERMPNNLRPGELRSLEVDVGVSNLVYFPIIGNKTLGSIGDAFARHNIKFGFSVGAGIGNSLTQKRIVLYHAKVIVMENAYKMADTQPNRGEFNFIGADKIITFGSENDLDVYGHGVSWALFNPSWVYDIPDSELRSVLTNHVRTVCAHYQGLSAIDTANEAYAGGARDSVPITYGLHAGPWEYLGEDYINISFNSCKDVTNLKVFYNSFFPHDGDATKAIQLLDSGLADGIGIQFHLTEKYSYQPQINRTKYIIQEARKRNKPVRFSEIGVLADSETLQANVYRDLVRLALDNNDVVTDFIIWGVIDPAWRGKVTLFNSDGSPKQAVYVILNELR